MAKAIKIGTWIKADKVRIVKKNGRRTLEIRRKVKTTRRRTAKRRKR